MTEAQTRRGVRVPDLLVERLLLGELAESEAAAVRERLAKEPGGQERLAAVQADNEAILRAYPPRQAAAAIRERHRHAVPESAGWRRLLPVLRTLGPALAVAAVAFAVVRGPQPEPHEAPSDTPKHQPTWVEPDLTPDPSGEQERAKGLQPHLRIYRKGAAGPELLQQGATVRAGEQLQVAYVAAGQRHGVIVSWDGAGNVTLHSPSAEDAAATLEPQQEHRLREAFELDTAPEFERFALVTANAPLQTSVVVEAARRLAADRGKAQTGALVLPADLQQTTFLLRKP